MTNNEAKQMVQQMAEELVSVQPMDPMLFQQLMVAAKDERLLIAEGFEPVSDHQILWIKK